MKKWIGWLCVVLLVLTTCCALASDTEVYTLDGITETVTLDDGISNDAALEGFINRAFGIGVSTGITGGKKAPQVTQGSKLTGQNALVYAFLRNCISEVANGYRSSTVFTMPVTDLLNQLSYTADELHVSAIIVNGAITQEAVDAMYAKLDYDFRTVLRALMVDCPYELYWYDKTDTGGCTWGYPGLGAAGNSSSEWIYFPDDGVVSFTMRVAKEYSVSNAYGTTNFDTSVATSIQTAAQNAADIVSLYSNESDYEKLLAYKNAICDLVSYNDEAADDDIVTPYGNPWQLIWVFDDDPTTEVVCEGYSKAFKYLCDESTFQTSVSASIVTGLMECGATSGGHMWNIVSMGNGQRYLVDVTNCDGSAVGAPDYLFMAGWSGHSGNTYTYTGSYNSVITYTYDSMTLGQYSAEELNLSNVGFDPTTYGMNVCGNNLTWQIDNGTLTISGSGDMYDYNHEVSPAPWMESGITSVIIEAGVTSIGNDAFAMCDDMTSITISGSVQSVGTYAFLGCSSLSEIEFAEGMESIGTGAFDGCSSLQRVYLPSTMTTITPDPWLLCNAISEFIVASNNPYYVTLDNVLFSSNWTELIYYPRGKADNSYEVPGAVTRIGDCAFYMNEFLTSILLPNRLESIGSEAFYDCALLQEVFVPNGIYSIGYSAFSGCQQLTGIALPDNLTGIEEGTFEGCSSLASVTIPASVISIGSDAFADCIALETVDYLGTETDSLQITISSGNEALTNAQWSYLPAGQLPKPVIYDIHLPAGLTAGGEFNARVSVPTGAEMVYVEFGRVDDSLGFVLECWDTFFSDSNNQLSALGFNMYEPGIYELRAMALTNDFIYDYPQDGDSEMAVYSFTLAAAELPAAPQIILSDDEVSFGDAISYIVPGAEAVTCQQYGLNGSDWGTNPPTNYTLGDSEAVHFLNPGWVGLRIWGRFNGVWSLPTEASVYVEPLGVFDFPTITLNGSTVDDEIDAVLGEDMSLVVEVANAATLNWYLDRRIGEGLGDESVAGDFVEGNSAVVDLGSCFTMTGEYVFTASAGYQEGWLTQEKSITIYVEEYASPFRVKNGVITKYTGTDTEVIIPNEIYGQLITGIGEFAFYGCEQLTSVTLPSCLVSLDYGAFLDTGLTSVLVPDGTPTRTWYFYEPDATADRNPRLYSVDLPVGVENPNQYAPFLGTHIASISPDFITPIELTSIEDEAFFGTAATYVWITELVASIGDDAFSNCSDLQFVHVPYSCQSIGENAFPPETVLLVDWGSYAYDYAEENGYDYILYAEGFNG